MTSAPDSIRRIYATVSRIPKGRVATYGQVAEVAGLPRRARLVGRALRELDEDSDVPWHRVVNAKGTISLRGDLLDHEGLQEHLLRREGVAFDGRAISLERYGWQATARGAKSADVPKRSPRSRPAARAIAVKRVYESAVQDRRHARAGRSPVAARHRQGQGARRRLAQGGRSEHRASDLVRPRSRPLDRVSAPLPPRARYDRRGQTHRASLRGTVR